MNAKELAALLDGREYGNEMTRDEELKAKAAGLVVVFGASDDLVEFRGAIRDEADCYDGGPVLVDAGGLLPERESIEDDDELRRFFARKPKARTIDTLWCNEPGYAWTYKTDIPHETFEIVEDGEPYCRGIVFSVDDLVSADCAGRTCCGKCADDLER